ncbi:MAG: M23 family metallopeptidase [Candidatus Cloacimonetes bacterium]|nr:M23 family metallopeptidase [Candidatus Cloacimonadota bacterium]
MNRKLNITYQYGLDGKRKTLFVSRFTVIALLALVTVSVVLSFVFLLFYAPALGERAKTKELQKENELLRDRLESFATQIDSIKAQIGINDSIPLNGGTYYPYVDTDKEHEDPWLETRISYIGKGIVLINEQLHSSELDDYELLLKQYPELALSDGKPSIYPTFGSIASGWGMRIHPIYGNLEYHTGLDFANGAGTPIYATAAGVISYVGYERGYGRHVRVKHAEGYETRYAHLYSTQVRKGDFVKKGQIIALMGSTGVSTGNHLHYEVLVKGVKVNPSSYLNRIDFDLFTQR